MTDLQPMILVAHAAVTWALVGLIWTIQLVHYPLFSWVAKERFVAFEREHRKRISKLVVPLMLAEVALAGTLVMWPGLGASPLEARVGAALVVGIWLSTFLIQVPCHEALSRAFDPAVHRRLVLTNWIRTGAWSLRGFLALAMLFL